MTLAQRCVTSFLVGCLIYLIGDRIGLPIGAIIVLCFSFGFWNGWRN